MATLQRLNIKDAVWLFNQQNREKVLAERIPAELVEEGYMNYLNSLFDTDWTEPDEEEEPIDEQMNPYEVVELSDADVLALSPCDDYLFHVGTTTSDQLPEMDKEFRFALEDGLDDYDPTEEEKEAMQERIDGSFLVELIEAFSKSTGTVEYAYASETVEEGLWGAALRFTRTKDEALAAWKKWLDEHDWYWYVAIE